MKTPPSHPVLSGGTWGAMSGENPKFPSSIEATHHNLVRILRKMGLRFQETHGQYEGKPERSVLIYKPREDQMKTLGKLFGQESVVHSVGGNHKLHYTNGPHDGGYRGIVPGAPPHEWFHEPPADAYTHIPSNGYFRCNFDFDGDPIGTKNPTVRKSVKKSIFARLRKNYYNDNQVMEDAILEQGGNKTVEPGHNPSHWDSKGQPNYFASGIGHTKRVGLDTCISCGNQRASGRGAGARFCPECDEKHVAGMAQTSAIRTDDPQSTVYTWEQPGSDEKVWYGVNRSVPVQNPTVGVPTPDREAWARSPILKQREARKGAEATAREVGLIKAWPKDKAENQANMEAHQVFQDYAQQEGTERGYQPTVSPSETTVTGQLNRLGAKIQTVKDLDRAFFAPVRNNRLANLEQEQDLDLRGEAALDMSDRRIWGQTPANAIGSTNSPNLGTPSDLRGERLFWSHPHFYEWHDGHTAHHNAKPWDKQGAIETARSLGLIKNDQAAGVGVSTYARFAAPYGQVQPGQPSNLFHYDYRGKLKDVADLVKRHGYQVYYGGGQHGQPDLAHRNYNTGHLMIYDPTPQSGGDFGNRDYTDAWRQMHELAHALTYKDLNNVYGEGRRMGKLGTHRTMNEAMRAVHWEHLAAHKQRELSKQIGVHIPDEVFNKEYNTVMHDAVHRAVTGKFTEPSQEGFVPHSHQVPLQTALDMVRSEGQKMGLQGHHDLVARKSEPKYYEVKLEKAWPKDKVENESNANAHAVMEDAILEQGGSKQESFDHIPLSHEVFVPGLEQPVNEQDRDSDSQCVACGKDTGWEAPEGYDEYEGYDADYFAPGEQYAPDYCPECSERVNLGELRTQDAQQQNNMANASRNIPGPANFATGLAWARLPGAPEDPEDGVHYLNAQPPGSDSHPLDTPHAYPLGVPTPDRSAWERSPLNRKKAK